MALSYEELVAARDFLSEQIDNLHFDLAELTAELAEVESELADIENNSFFEET